MQAVDSVPARIDIELAVDNHPVARLRRDPSAQVEVVVELQLIADAVSHLDVLVVADLGGRLEHRRVEGHLRARSPGKDVSMHRGIIGMQRTRLQPEIETYQGDRRDSASGDQWDDPPPTSRSVPPPGSVGELRLPLCAPDAGGPLAVTPRPPTHVGE